jgi:hypothetical protein
MALLKTDNAAPPSAPRFATGWAAIVYAACTLLLGYPALAGRFLVNQHSDQYIAGYAFRDFAASTLRSTGGFPLWDPYLFGGMPYVAAMHGDIFYPTFLLRMILPTDVAMTWGFILHLFLAGLFTYLFLRAVGFSFYASLVGGVAYMMGGNVAGLVSPGHDGKLYLSALLPLTLLLLYRGMREGKRWAWGALGLVVGLAVLTPHPQLLQYLLLMGGAWGLFLAFSSFPDGTPLPRPIALRRLGFALGSVLLGGAIGAIQYLPVKEYVPWSPRAGGKGWEHAISFSLPTEELINTYLPQFSGILDHYWGRNSIHLHSEYIGAAVLVLAGLGFGAWRAEGGARRKFIWFWIGSLIITLLWALGGSTPFFSLVYAIVPGTKFFRAPSTMLYVVSFCVAVLAAAGVERALARRFTMRYPIGWLIAGGLIALLGTMGGLTNLATSIADPRLSQYVDENAAAVVAGAWRSFAFVALVSGVLIALKRGSLTAERAGWALTGIVAVDLWSILRLYWLFSAPASQLYASDPVIDYLKHVPVPGRVVPLITDRLESPTRDPYFGGGDGRAAGFMVHGIRSLVGYHGNELGRYDALTGWENPETYQSQLGNPKLWRLLNLKYWYTNKNEPPLPGMRLLAGPARNAAGNTTYLYEIPGDNPDAWVAPMIVKAPDENVLATLFEPRLPDVISQVALFDTSAAVKGQTPTTQLPAPLSIRATTTRPAPGRISVQLDKPAPEGSALMVSENFYPGWQATADGKPVTVGRADYSLIGVPLPAGARRVDLEFRSQPYETGKAITLAALLICVLLAGGGALLEKRANG